MTLKELYELEATNPPLIGKSSPPVRTRAWTSETSSTVVQFRNDLGPGSAKVHIHTGLGWIPAGNSIDISDEEAEKLAEASAKGWNLVEADESHARWLAGWDDEE